MKVDLTKLIAGQSPRKMRDFCRTFHSHIFTSESIAHFFGKDITADLRKARLIKPSTELRGRFTLAAKGARWSNVLFLPRFKRLKADRMVADMLARARSINSNSSLLYWVDEIHAFGGYVKTPMPSDLGDIDLIIYWKRKPVPRWYEDYREWCRERARRAGKDDFHFYDYGLTEVRRLLRARNAYLSFHDPEQRKHLKKDAVINLIYSRRKPRRTTPA
jgi:hypothetical protein